ncbi:MAG: SpoIIE family protein phosphatase [Oscillospiraceae bacterium]|jgi:stage II sporulation protein E|nr:SpoIIE family protein phosphatase [Oscillospiraceae bacterium]
MQRGGLRAWARQSGVNPARLLAGRGVSPALRRGALLLFRFAMGYLLTRAEMFSGRAPFGVGFVAAGGVDTMSFFGFIGALCGYAGMPDLSDGLRYAAVAVLVFAAGFVFQDTGAAQKPMFMPLVTVAAGGFVGVVFVAADGFPLSGVLLYVAEVVMMTGAAYFFRTVLGPAPAAEAAENPPLSMRRLISLLILVSCLFLSLSRLVLFGGLSPARCAALLLVLLLARRGGVGAGSTSGLSVGLALDLSAGTPFYAVAYGLTGLISGVFQGAGKPACAGLGVLVTAVSAQWAQEESARLFAVCEAAVAAVAFLLIPDDALPFLSAGAPRRAAGEEERLRDTVRQRLRGAAASFRSLYEALTGYFVQGGHSNDEDIATVFDRTTDRVCKKCALVTVCWDKESLATFHALTDTASAMLARGALEPSDFPTYFSARCLNFARFVSVGNEELTALMYRRQFKAKLRENRAQLCRQYAELAQILQWTAEEAAAAPAYDREAENRLSHYLRSVGVEGRVAVSLGAARRTRVEIAGENLSALSGGRRETARALSTLLGVPLGPPEQERGVFGERIVLTESEPLATAIGVAARQKQGQTVNGDNGAHFKTDDGILYLLLSDGMGSGQAASVDSGQAVRLLERFLRAGIPPENALSTLNSALVLRGEQRVGFVTVDLVALNLLNGDVVFYKCGAAPSYLRCGRKVTRVMNGALPAGLSAGDPAAAPDVTRLRVGPGALLLLASDGVADPEADDWLCRLLAEWGDGSPRELAGQVLEAGARERGRVDDMTVMALRVERRRDPS